MLKPVSPLPMLRQTCRRRRCFPPPPPRAQLPPLWDRNDCSELGHGGTSNKHIMCVCCSARCLPLPPVCGLSSQSCIFMALCGWVVCGWWSRNIVCCWSRRPWRVMSGDRMRASRRMNGCLRAAVLKDGCTTCALLEGVAKKWSFRKCDVRRIIVHARARFVVLVDRNTR